VCPSNAHTAIVLTYPRRSRSLLVDRGMQAGLRRHRLVLVRQAAPGPCRPARWPVSVMTTLISYQSSGGDQGRCDAKCYNAWGPECHCICQGANHGIGKQGTIENTRELAGSWLEQAQASGQDIGHAEVLADALHQPLFSLGGAV
jgi:hypothetical protein